MKTTRQSQSFQIKLEILEIGLTDFTKRNDRKRGEERGTREGNPPAVRDGVHRAIKKKKITSKLHFAVQHVGKKVK